MTTHTQVYISYGTHLLFGVWETKYLVLCTITIYFNTQQSLVGNCVFIYFLYFSLLYYFQSPQLTFFPSVFKNFYTHVGKWLFYIDLVAAKLLNKVLAVFLWQKMGVDVVFLNGVLFWLTYKLLKSISATMAERAMTLFWYIQCMWFGNEIKISSSPVQNVFSMLGPMKGYCPFQGIEKNLRMQILGVCC